MEKQLAYVAFVNRSFSGKLVLLELGVGLDTPSIIRWPFEWIASQHPNATLLRVNQGDATVPKEIKGKSVGFQEDAARVVRDLLQLVL
ncbi:MAG TPA: hypothetical protein PKY77_18505 [Phycisphaerae bacterium]|nr:hypothetical protein [Phycisphaerae bacterium]HRY70901.1 hypothetical protein [Phycisphaerae bacterium]HSA29405.1 hypothetical protein [Phycisphaerae bacterium]